MKNSAARFGFLLWLCLPAIASPQSGTAAAPAARRELPSATPAECGLDARRLGEIGPAVQELIDRGELSGAVVLVLRRGHVVFSTAQGERNVAADEAMTPDTIFRIYSMTKPITSVALLTLYDEGKLELGDPVSLYLPEFEDLEVYAGGSGEDIELEPAGREMTVRDLLRHTAGLTYGVFGQTPVDLLYRDAGIMSPQDDLAAFTEKLGRLPLLYQPGTRWMYSVACDVQGRLIEVISGKTFDRFLKERVFDPLQMVDTGFHVPADKLARLAVNYGWKRGDELPVVDDPATSPLRQPVRFLSGGGGLVSTARDYARFCQMLLGGGELDGRRILKAETVALMTQNQLPEEVAGVALGPLPDKTLGFGLGVSVRIAARSRAERLGEYAWGGLASTDFWISPRDELAVIVLSQSLPYSDRLVRVVKPRVYASVLPAEGQ